MIRAVIVDIEGTTSSLAFVKEVLFPHARRHLRDFLTRRVSEPEVRAALDEANKLAERPTANLDDTIAILEKWMDEDRKATPLKALQGLIWEEGYRSGRLRSHVYPDVVPALRRLTARGLPLHVYSSGSVRAQHAFFEHTNEGNLRGWFAGFFDTTTGPKVEATSYGKIARALDLPPQEILFLSDARAELEAATAAGLQVVGVSRDVPAATLSPYPAVTSFDDFALDDSGAVLTLDGAQLEALLAFARRCHQRGWALATSGNFSLRLERERIAITVSGRHKGQLSRDDLVVLAGTQPATPTPGPAPSAETALHRALYRRFSLAAAVAHTHSVAATVLSRRLLEQGALRLTGYEMQKALSGVSTHEAVITLPIVANTQDMGTLSRALDEALDRFPTAPAYLVAGHGLTTWANDVPDLERHVEALEFLLACELAASGSPPP